MCIRDSCKPIALDHRIGLQNIQRGQRSRAGQWVARITMRMQEGALACVVQKAIENLLVGQHRAQRQKTAGEAFGQAQQIRQDASLLAGEQRDGAAEAHRDFIGDQKHAVQVTQVTHALQVAWVVHPHAAGALHQRLDDHRAYFAGVRFQHLRKRIGGAFGAGDGLGVIAAAEGIGRGREQYIQQPVSYTHLDVYKRQLDGQ